MEQSEPPRDCQKVGRAWLCRECHGCGSTLGKTPFRRRQAFKDEAGQTVETRDEQFKQIAQLTETARQQGNPVMSMDVKKKELIGFFPSGQTLQLGANGSG